MSCSKRATPKGFSDEYYRQTVEGSLAPVLAALEAIQKAKRHLEIVTLIVPTLNDRPADLEAEVAWIARTLVRFKRK